MKHPKTFETPPKHSKHRHNIRNTPTTFERTRTRTDGHERRAVMKKTGSYGKDGQLWKRWADMEKTSTYGRRALMELKDEQLWKRRAVMEKTGSYGKDGHLWKRRALMEKTGTYGKDGNKAFKSEIFYSHRAQPV